ncbi:MAG: DUF1598 domain-containing protein [Planctomycetota bacterium]|nr:DUF1598 domain-containing protein [Planctomycetota bacterium]
MRKSSNLFTPVLLVVFWAACSPSISWGQAGGGGGGNIGGDLSGVAGVLVDPEGVLKLRTYEDPNGALMRSRINAARAALPQDIRQRSPLRKVSLNRLEKALADAIDNNRQPDDAMLYLAGLNRLEYVFYYPETQDIVIAGPAEGWVHDASDRVVGIHTGQPCLELQDLIVALRTFSPGSLDDTVITVSIDPTQEGLQRMQQFLANLRGVRPSDATRIATGLQNSLGLQEVAFNGVAANTHFAQVLVEADYRMKLIGIGLEKPPVRLATYIDKANPASVARNAMRRWYFVPDYERVMVSDDDLAMEMVGEGVKLIGEDEVVNRDGSRSGVGQVDRASRVFTHSFTRAYRKMAEKSPIWAQLRNLIDLSVAAAFIRDQHFYEMANWSMPVFSDEGAYPVQTYNTPVRVETAVNVRWKGNTLMTPVGGGVRIQATEALTGTNLKSDNKGSVKEAHAAVQPEKIDHSRWWWD